MSAIASQITSVSIIYSIVCSAADQRKHQSSASLAYLTRINRSPVNSPHKGPGVVGWRAQTKTATGTETGTETDEAEGAIGDRMNENFAYVEHLIANHFNREFMLNGKI